jgi:NTP pyrophosphatase (non-canonical NTP hydrolase)
MPAAKPASATSAAFEIRAFAAERDWDQFHSPKNLASALAVEAAELLEPFQWLTEARAESWPRSS